MKGEELISANALKIIARERLSADDFGRLATRLGGWEDVGAFAKHLAFVKDHQHKVERIAVIVGHDWQRWLVATFKIFLHPNIRAFEQDRESEALEWVLK